jgi:putative ABC transport system substrate-binding protein
MLNREVIMKKMKRILTAALVTVMAVSTIGCGKKEEGKKEIGVIKLVDHVALNQSEEGFVAALKEKGFVDGENLKITYQNGQNDTNNLSTIADKFVGDKVDLIFAIATPSAQAAAGKTTTIPIIATAITDFTSAGLVETDAVPNTNVSGTSDMNPIAAQVDLMLQLCPDVKTVGFLYNSSEPNSVLQADITKAILDEKGISYVEQTVSSTNEVQQAAASIVTECDAIYLPTDNVMASSMATINEITVSAKIPVICGESGMVKSGGFATLGINYYNLGYQAGEMAVKVLNGEDISKMPVEFSTNYDYCINKEVTEALGITIPEELKEYVISTVE